MVCLKLPLMKNPWTLTTLCIVLAAGVPGCSKEDAAAKKVNVPAMMAALKSDSKETRDDACVELAKAGPRAKAAVPLLIPLLKNKDHVSRRLAAYVLGEIGPEAKAALPALKEMLNDTDREVLKQVANSLRSIDPKNNSDFKNENVTY